MATSATLIPENISYIRFLQASPDAPLMDLYINNKLIAANWGYQNFTDYLRAYPGLYRVELYKAGTKADPIYSAHLNLQSLLVYTAAFIGCCGQNDMLLIPDSLASKTRPTGTWLRFINLIPLSPSLDIYLDGNLIISRIAYEEISKYLPLATGTYTLDVRRSDTGETIIYHPQMELKAGNLYTGFFTGLIDGQPAPQVLLPLEGVSYLTF